jgi:hypothetical protein
MQGTAGAAGDPNSQDEIDRESSRVAAVACFFPPTDFFNYGKPGEDALGRGILKGFRAPFDFEEMDDETKRFVEITEEPAGCGAWLARSAEGFRDAGGLV